MAHPDSQPERPSAMLTPRDVEIARAMLARLKAGKDLRQDKIRRLKQAIKCGEYENSLKLDVAAERVVDAINPSAQKWDLA